MAIEIHAPILAQIRERVEGVQKLYRFENNFGASVVKGVHTYGGEDGLWEMAPVFFKDATNTNYVLCYPPTVCPDGDVVGWLSGDEVEAKLSLIKLLDDNYKDELFRTGITHDEESYSQVHGNVDPNSLKGSIYNRGEGVQRVHGDNE